MNWELISLPIVAAVIGWGTNVIAIRMLFWPREPIRFFGFELLGVLPKRKQDIARSIGEVLNDDLLPTEELIAAVNSEETRTRVARLITDNLTAKIQRFLPALLWNMPKRDQTPSEDLVVRDGKSLYIQARISAKNKEQRFLAKLGKIR